MENNVEIINLKNELIEDDTLVEIIENTYPKLKAITYYMDLTLSKVTDPVFQPLMTKW